MGKLLSWLLEKFAFDALYSIIYYGLVAMTVTAIIAMWGGFIVGIFYFYDLVQTLLNLVTTGGGGSDLVSKFYGLLNCIGLTTAFNDTKTIIIGGVSFLFGRILFTVTVNTYLMFIRLITPLLSK